MKANMEWIEFNYILFTIYVHIGEVKAFKPSLPLNHNVRSGTLRLDLIINSKKLLLNLGYQISHDLRLFWV